MAAPVVGLVGMKALRRDIKHLTDDQQSALYRAIKAAGKDAAEPIAARARAEIPKVGKNAGRLAGDVRTSGTKTGAAVRMGRKTIPYAGWVEFGGRRTKPHESEREFVPSGRYLFPAAEGLASVAASKYSTAIANVLESSGVWSNAGADGSQVRD